MAFDENDPSLMSELAELGFDDDEMIGVANVSAGHRARPVSSAGGSDAHLGAQDPGDLLKSLGVSLNSIGGDMVSFILIYFFSQKGGTEMKALRLPKFRSIVTFYMLTE